MAYGDPWPPPLWDNSTANYYSGTTPFTTTYVYSGSAAYPTSTWAESAPVIRERVESAMEWLRRRVIEITDLAHAEV